jgi:hypothetical protein
MLISRTGPQQRLVSRRLCQGTQKGKEPAADDQYADLPRRLQQRTRSARGAAGSVPPVSIVGGRPISHKILYDNILGVRLTIIIARLGT